MRRLLTPYPPRRVQRLGTLSHKGRGEEKNYAGPASAAGVNFSATPFMQ